MTWITFIPFAEATGRLKVSYEKFKRPNNTIANILSVHSLRPHTLDGHVALYRSVIGHSANKLPLWYLESVGVHVSAINQCNYCITHHTHLGGLAYNGDKSEWATIAGAMVNDTAADVFEGKMLALMGYAKKLTQNPSALTEQDMDTLHKAGADDGEILEVNQVAAYFAYANRTVLGLGVSLDGEVFAT